MDSASLGDRLQNTMSKSIQEQDLILERAKNMLLEHCSKLIIIAEFIPDHPSDAGQIRTVKYASLSEALGLLGYGTEKVKHALWQDFEPGDDYGQESNV